MRREEPEKVTRMRKFFSIRDKDVIDYIDELRQEIRKLRQELREKERSGK